VRLRLLVEAGARIIPVDDHIASRAGALRADHYERSTCAISLADCCALATSLALTAPLATADPALAAVARACGCEVIPLPDSRGARP
jgi:predicted nucleic acid-binding protein